MLLDHNLALESDPTSRCDGDTVTNIPNENDSILKPSKIRVLSDGNLVHSQQRDSHTIKDPHDFTKSDFWDNNGDLLSNDPENPITGKSEKRDDNFEKVKSSNLLSDIGVDLSNTPDEQVNLATSADENLTSTNTSDLVSDLDVQCVENWDKRGG